MLQKHESLGGCCLCCFVYAAPLGQLEWHSLTVVKIRWCVYKCLIAFAYLISIGSTISLHSHSIITGNQNQKPIGEALEAVCCRGCTWITWWLTCQYRRSLASKQIWPFPRIYLFFWENQNLYIKNLTPCLEITNPNSMKVGFQREDRWQKI